MRVVNRRHRRAEAEARCGALGAPRLDVHTRARAPFAPDPVATPFPVSSRRPAHTLAHNPCPPPLPHPLPITLPGALPQAQNELAARWLSRGAKPLVPLAARLVRLFCAVPRGLGPSLRTPPLSPLLDASR